MLTIEQAAKLLRLSERTLHNWEAGRVRIPYAAYKLIRILRGYELPGDAWKGYRLIGDTLWSPENLPFHASDARWWSLTVCMAHEYRKQSKLKQASRSDENGARAKVEDVRDPAHVASAGAIVLRSRKAESVTIPAAHSLQKRNNKRPTPPREGVRNAVFRTPSSNTGCIEFNLKNMHHSEFAGGAR